MNDQATRFLIEQNNETLRFLIGQKITFLNSAINVCMSWWVSFIVFCGSVLAFLWLKRAELKKQNLANLLGITLSVSFFAAILFGVLVIVQLEYVESEIAALSKRLGEQETFFKTELQTFRWAMGFGAFSFLLVLIAWEFFWYRLRKSQGRRIKSHVNFMQVIKRRSTNAAQIRTQLIPKWQKPKKTNLNINRKKQNTLNRRPSPKRKS